MSSQINLDLHEKQGEAFLSPASEVLYGGAAGGGKSHLFRVAAISWCYDIPGLQTYFFRRTYPDLWRNHMVGEGSLFALLSPYMDTKHVQYKADKNAFQFWNGSQIILNHCQYQKDVYNYQGAEIHVLIIDELTQWPKDMYTYLRSRVRLGGLQIPDKYKGFFPRILAGSNPGGIGHNWVKSDWIDPYPPFEAWTAPRKEGGFKRQFIPALLEDNPTLIENDPGYEDRLEGMGAPHLVQAMRWGDWDIVAGGALDDVWDKGKHIIEPFEIPKAWRVDRSFDWGSSKPFAVCWWAEANGEEVKLKDGRTWAPPKGTIFLIAEYYGWNGNANEGCKMLAVDVARQIKGFEDKMDLHVKPGPADSSIFDAENGVSIADDMARVGVKWTESNKSPGSRVSGLERIRQYLSNSLQHPMENPGLFIFNTCRHFIRTVPVLPRDDKKPDDVDTDAEDHIYDVTRYRLMGKKRDIKPFSPMG
jgi:hypothetical protein